MRKNSINEVAKTYQRLVEAAPQSPPMPLEAPDSGEVELFTWVNPDGSLPGESTDYLTSDLSTIYLHLNDVLQLLANCDQTNNCELLKSEYIRLTMLLKRIRERLGRSGAST